MTTPLPLTVAMVGASLLLAAVRVTDALEHRRAGRRTWMWVKLVLAVTWVGIAIEWAS